MFKVSTSFYQFFFSELTKKLSDGENFSKLAKDLQKSNENCKNNYERREQELLDTINDLKQQVRQLQDKLPTTAADPISPNVSLIDPEIVSDLRGELDLTKREITTLREENGRFTAENEEMKHLSHSLRLEISQLKTTLEEKDDEIMTYRESVREAQEEIKLMNAMEVAEEALDVDVAPKGNSLFAEVDDRRLLVEEQLKNYQIRVKELKMLNEKKVTENNKLRMQNIHLMNMASSSGSGAGKCEQTHVEHLHDLLKLERQKNLTLKNQLNDNHPTSDDTGFQEKLLQQTFEDGQKMHEMSKALAEQDRTMAKLKADNCKLKMRINEIQSQKVHCNEDAAKKKNAPKVVVENVVFDAKPSKPQIKLEPTSSLSTSSSHQKPLQESTNNMKTSNELSPPKSRKTVSFSDDTSEEPEIKKKITRVQVERKVIDAKAESEKMQEQCNQQ